MPRVSQGKFDSCPDLPYLPLQKRVSENGPENLRFRGRLGILENPPKNEPILEGSKRLIFVGSPTSDGLARGLH
jgi:hypothetical protein